MAFQFIFKRYEYKYLITGEQKRRLLDIMAEYLIPDSYGRTTIRNIYFDTPSRLLIRRSIEKPAYKEKLRVRSYKQADPDSTVFVELKKKYDSVVYKRRIAVSEATSSFWLSGNKPSALTGQIVDEVDYFLHYYTDISPSVFLSYEREAFVCPKESGLRITFDENILARQEDMSLCSGVYGDPLLPGGSILMEIKCAGGLPLWLTGFLSREKIYKTSFSKYGKAYCAMMAR